MADELAPNGCAGHCCAAFRLPLSLDELRAGVMPETGAAIRDGEQIAGMVIELDVDEARARLARSGSPHVIEGPPESGALFTCRHWDEDTRRCGIYAERPSMCRTYPYGRPCEHECGCTDG